MFEVPFIAEQRQVWDEEDPDDLIPKILVDSIHRKVARDIFVRGFGKILEEVRESQFAVGESGEPIRRTGPVRELRAI
jgi:hypothetical protein